MKRLFATVSALVFLTACGAGTSVGDERQSYIDASVEAICLLANSGNAFDANVAAQVSDVFEKYGFPASDDTAMEALTQKYGSDAEAQAAIADGVQGCFTQATESDAGEAVKDAAPEEAADAAVEEPKE